MVGLAEVVDPPAALVVHDLLVAELPLGGVAQLAPVVGLGVADEGLQVVAGGEVLARAGQHHHPHVVVGVGPVEGGVDAVDEGGVLGVGHVRPVHGDGGHVASSAVEDDRFAHRTVLISSGRSPQGRPASGGVAGRGSPRTRSPRMVRWISLVPAQIDDAW